MGIGGVVKPGFYRATDGAPARSQQALCEDPEKKEPQRDAAQPEEAQLAVTQLHELAEAAPPAARRHEGQDAFDHQHERERAPEGLSAHANTGLCGFGRYRRAPAAAAPPELCMARKKSDEGSSTITSLFLLKLCL